MSVTCTCIYGEGMLEFYIYIMGSHWFHLRIFFIGTMEDLHCPASPVSPQPPPAHKPDCSHSQLTTAATNVDTQSDLPPQKVLLFIILVCTGYLVPNELSMLHNGQHVI